MAVDLAKLRDMAPELLDKEEMSLRGEIWKLRLQMTTGQVQDPQAVRRKRHDLARVLTVRAEGRLGIEIGKKTQKQTQKSPRTRKSTR